MKPMLLQKNQLEAVRNWSRLANNHSFESLALELRIDFLWHMHANTREDSHLYLVVSDDEARLMEGWFSAYREGGFYNAIDDRTYHLIREHRNNEGDPEPLPHEANDYPGASWKTYRVSYLLPLPVRDKKTAVRLATNEWETVRSNLQVVIEEKNARTTPTAMRTNTITREFLLTMMNWFHAIRQHRSDEIDTTDLELYAMCQRWVRDHNVTLTITYNRDNLRLLQRWYATYRHIDVHTRRDQQALEWIHRNLETTTIIYEVDVHAESKQDVFTFLQEEWSDVVGSIRVSIAS